MVPELLQRVSLLPKEMSFRAFLALKSNTPQKPPKLVFGMIVTSFTSCHHVRMKIGPYIGCAVLVMVFGSAIFGMLIRRKLPESHLSDESKGVVTLSMGVVGTLTALVLSLLIATASGTFNTRNQEITLIAAKVIQLDRLLRRFGPETASLVRLRVRTNSGVEVPIGRSTGCP